MSRRSRTGGRTRKKGRVPTAEDFTGRSVQKAVLSETIQHPLTLLPFGVAGVTLLYMLLLQDTSIGLVLLCLLSGLLSVCSWIVNFVIRGESLAKRHVKKLQQLRAESFLHEVQNVGTEFAAAGFGDGAQAADELTEAYEQLRGFLQSRASEGSLSVQRFVVLAQDAYREGLSVLRRALGIFQALQAVDRQKLQDELQLWRQELVRAQQHSHNQRIDSISKKIAGHERRLQKYEERVAQLSSLLARCEELEGALETAYMDVVDMIEADASLESHTGAAEQLEQAVEAARRVENRLRGIYQEDNEDEEIYRQAGSA